MKILVNIDSGLNDTIGGLCYIIDFCYRSKIPYSNIDFYSKNYVDIIKIVDFHDVNFLKEFPADSYDLIYDHYNGTDTDRNIGLHISNFITIRSEYKDLFSENFDRVGIHFRFMDSEYRKMSVEDEFDSYMVNFNKIYNRADRYILYSDHPIVKEIRLDNVEIMCPELEINIKNQDNNRRETAEKAILDVYSMSCCRKLYKTKGYFTSLCKIFNSSLKTSYLF